jgi:hypothetical protein
MPADFSIAILKALLSAELMLMPLSYFAPHGFLSLG